MYVAYFSKSQAILITYLLRRTEHLPSPRHLVNEMAKQLFIAQNQSRNSFERNKNIFVLNCYCYDNNVQQYENLANVSLLKND